MEYIRTEKLSEHASLIMWVDSEGYKVGVEKAEMIFLVVTCKSQSAATRNFNQRLKGEGKQHK